MEKLKTVTDFIFLDSKITENRNCIHEIKTFTPWKKSHGKPRKCIKKQKHHLANKGPCSQSYGLSSVLYGCENWTINKAECQKINALGLWCWGRLLRVTWIAMRSNQKILKEINHEYSLEGLMLKLSSNTLATRFEEPTHWKTP